MAGVDSSIYSQFQPLNAMGFVEQGLRLSDMMKQRKIAAKEEQFNDTLKSAYKADETGKLSFDAGKLSELATIDPQKAYALQKQGTADAAAARKQQLDEFRSKATMGAQMLGGIADANSYNALRPKLIQVGIYDEHELPAQYDPQFVRGAQMQALEAKDRLDQHWKEQEFALKQNEFGLKQDESVRKGEESKVGLLKTRAEIGKLNADAAKARKEGSTSLAGGKSEGFKALDKDYAKDFNDWTSAGRAAVDKNLDRLRQARAALAGDSSLTGWRGNLPDAIRNVTNEKAIQTRDDVRAAAQGALKAALGASFTEKEGERIMNQAYNEKLSPEANLAKIDAAIKELETARDSNERKARYFQERGSLAGLDAAGQPVRQAAAASAAHPQDSIAVEWAKANPGNPKAAQILQLNGVQ